MDFALIMRDGGYGADVGLTPDFDLAEDNGLRTALVVSLGTDRRALAGDILPDNTTDRRGWWADTYNERSGDLIGCRLWLLWREKILPETLRRAEDYAREGLQWLVEDKIAVRVDVAAHADGDALVIDGAIHKPDGSVYRWGGAWTAEQVRFYDGI